MADETHRIGEFWAWFATHKLEFSRLSVDEPFWDIALEQIKKVDELLWFELSRVQLCSEKLSGLWRIGRWHVRIQQRGSGHASCARPEPENSRTAARGRCGSCYQLRGLDGLCSRQLSPYSVLGPHMPATNASSRGDALATERPQYCVQRESSVAQA